MKEKKVIPFSDQWILNMEQEAIDFYLSKHISEVRSMNAFDENRFYRGQQYYAERCKALLKAAMDTVND